MKRVKFYIVPFVKVPKQPQFWKAQHKAYPFINNAKYAGVKQKSAKSSQRGDESFMNETHFPS